MIEEYQMLHNGMKKRVRVILDFMYVFICYIILKVIISTYSHSIGNLFGIPDLLFQVFYYYLQIISISSIVIKIFHMLVNIFLELIRCYLIVLKLILEK